MAEPFNIPTEYRESFRRILPYMASPLRNDETVMHAVFLYLKLGNEKLARIAIDAYNENYRLSELEYRRRLREEALLSENLEEDDNEEEDDSEDEEEEDSGFEEQEDQVQEDDDDD
ncbi:MAG: hypothetical protein P8X55_06815 [Desulfosarcinaceae bacterium]